MFENITSSEIAGYAVGTLLLSATITAPKFDSFISSSQRRSLGMCKRCGDLKMIACSRCKGSGSIREGGGPLGLIPAVGESAVKKKLPFSNNPPCASCGARGHFHCPVCSQLPKP